MGSVGIRLRRWDQRDAPALVAAWSDPEIAAHCRVPPGADIERALRWISGWAARAESGEAIDLVVVPVDDEAEVWGEVGLRPLRSSRESGRLVVELGWWVRADRRGQGVGTAAVGLATRWAAAEWAGEAVVARIPRGADASEAVARRCGFRCRGPLDDTHDLWVREPDP